LKEKRGTRTNFLVRHIAQNNVDKGNKALDIVVNFKKILNFVNIWDEMTSNLLNNYQK
jgi:hypothetical protein